MSITRHLVYVEVTDPNQFRESVLDLSNTHGIRFVKALPFVDPEDGTDVWKRMGTAVRERYETDRRERQETRYALMLVGDSCMAALRSEGGYYRASMCGKPKKGTRADGHGVTFPVCGIHGRKGVWSRPVHPTDLYV